MEWSGADSDSSSPTSTSGTTSAFIGATEVTKETLQGCDRSSPAPIGQKRQPRSVRNASPDRSETPAPVGQKRQPRSVRNASPGRSETPAPVGQKRQPRSIAPRSGTVPISESMPVGSHATVGVHARGESARYPAALAISIGSTFSPRLITTKPLSVTFSPRARSATGSKPISVSAGIETPLSTITR